MTKPDRYHLPSYQSPEGYTAFSYLKYLCNQGLERIMQDPNKKTLYSIYTEQLEKELDIIKNCSLEDLLLISHDLTQFASEKNILYHSYCTMVCSMVSYLLEQGALDPIEHALNADLFYNENDLVLPTPAVIFEHLKMPVIQSYLEKKYGKENIAKPIIRFLDETNTRIERPLPAGFIITDKPVKCYFSDLKLYDGVNTIPHKNKDIQKQGFPVFSFLGIRTLTILAETARRIRPDGKIINFLNKIPLDDSLTYRLLCSGDTKSISQLESEDMKNILKRICPANFNELTVIIYFYYQKMRRNIDHLIEAYCTRQIFEPSKYEQQRHMMVKSALFAYRMAYLKTHHKKELYATIKELKKKNLLNREYTGSGK